MGTFFVYILKTSICLTGFYLFYRLLLSKETFHRFNRVALLGILLLSQLIPFCEITVPEESEVQQTLLTIEQILTLADHVPQTEVEVLPSSSCGFPSCCVSIYWEFFSSSDVIFIHCLICSGYCMAEGRKS